MKHLDKKGQMGNLQGFIMGIVTVAIVLAVGLIVLQSLVDTQSPVGGGASAVACGTNSTGGSGGTILYTGCGSAYNSTSTIMTKLTSVPTWIGIIIVVALAFVVLSFFYGRGK